MNTRLWKRFGCKLAQATMEFFAGVLCMMTIIVVAAGIVSAAGWVLRTFIGADMTGSILGGLTFLIAAVWVGWEILSLFKKTKREIDTEDNKIMAILAGNNNGDNP